MTRATCNLKLQLTLGSIIRERVRHWQCEWKLCSIDSDLCSSFIDGECFLDRNDRNHNPWRDGAFVRSRSIKLHKYVSWRITEINGMSGNEHGNESKMGYYVGLMVR